MNSQSVELSANYALMSLIQSSIWGDPLPEVTCDVYKEMKKHALTVLPAGILSSLSMPDNLRQVWQIEIYQQIAYNANYNRAQKSLPITVPYVILKGSSAAKYYPHPQYRNMGDIDIMTRREDFATACEMLIQNGYREITGETEKAQGRHRAFVDAAGVEVEIHAYYAYQNEIEKAEFFDNLIIQSINSSHELPDMVNGLVLLEHISYHIERGLGLRQIIDWMMFVNQCLPDEKWPEFRILAQKAGLEQLAVITTQMCVAFLGLQKRMWCSDASDEICSQMMVYILSSGNFGIKKTDGNRASVSFLASTRTIKGLFSFLQGRGVINWKAAHKHVFLRPFAWIYQICKYIKKGLIRKNTMQKLKEEFKESKAYNTLFDALGISREEKGLVVYKNGRYMKE